MEEPSLSPELLESLRQQILCEHPEMEGAEWTVTPRRLGAEQAAIAAKLGLPTPKAEEEPHYVVTLTRRVEAEDGVVIPLVVRVTVDAQGRVIRSGERR